MLDCGSRSSPEAEANLGRTVVARHHVGRDDTLALPIFEGEKKFTVSLYISRNTVLPQMTKKRAKKIVTQTGGSKVTDGNVFEVFCDDYVVELDVTVDHLHITSETQLHNWSKMRYISHLALDHVLQPDQQLTSILPNSRKGDADLYARSISKYPK